MGSRLDDVRERFARSEFHAWVGMRGTLLARATATFTVMPERRHDQ